MRKMIALLLICVMCMGLTACGSASETATVSTNAESTESTTVDENETSSEEAKSTSEDSADTAIVDNSYAEDEEALVDEYAGLFEQVEYTDDETGLSITYNVYLPEGYDESESYPMVVFIGDSSCAGTDATYSLTQGLGALVWAADEWQEVNPSIVIVPTYPETILDDHGEYTTTEYVEMTKNFIEDMEETYAVDTDRVYGTGQSMGCMTTLILATEYPDLYTACMFVDGQWDISTLSNLEDLTFVYFAAEDDTNAYNGMQEVMAMFDEDGVSYSYSQWDGTWSSDELSTATEELFTGESNAYFISWATGTIEADTESSAGNFGGSAPSDNSVELTENDSMSTEDKPQMEALEGSEMPENFGGPSDSESEMSEGEMSTSMNSSAYHMASFDYAYSCIAVMEWLFEQTK